MELADSMEVMLMSYLPTALRCEWEVSPWEAAILPMVVFFGMFFGAWISGNIADKYGRRLSLFWSIGLTLLASLLCSISPSIWWLIAFRFFVGVGIGGGHVALTLLAEFLPISKRAKVLTIPEFFWAAGSIGAAVLAWMVLPRMGWRWLLFFTSLPLLFLLCYMPFIPESLRFLVVSGRIEQAQEVLNSMAKWNKKPNIVFTEYEELMELRKNNTEKELIEQIGEIQKQVKTAERENQFQERGRMLLLVSSKLRFTTLLVWLMWFLMNFSYFGVILVPIKLSEAKANGERCSDGKSILVDSMIEGIWELVLQSSYSKVILGLTDLLIVFGSCISFLWDHVITIVISLVASLNGTSLVELHIREMFGNECAGDLEINFLELFVSALSEIPGVILVFFLLDFLGRKKTILFTFGVGSLCMFAMIACSPAPLQTTIIFIARAVFTGGFQATMVYTSEVYPTSVRSVGVGVAMAFGRVGGMMSPFVVEVLTSYSSVVYSLIIYGIGALITAWASFLLPIETSHRELSDSIELWNLDHNTEQTKEASLMPQNIEKLPIIRNSPT